MIFGAGSLAADHEGGADFFPFKKGRYWIYTGTVRYVENGEVHEQTIKQWKSEVMDVVSGKDFQAALLKGHPGDLAWFEKGRQRGDVMFVLTKAGEFHEFKSNEDAAQNFAKIKASGEIPAGLLSEGTIIFKTSMHEGDRFGDPEQTKLGARYCWVVDGIMPGVQFPSVKGIAASKSFTSYMLAFRASPDHQNLHFVPGLGIVFYEYKHHGTAGDCEMSLVEVGMMAEKKRHD